MFFVFLSCTSSTEGYGQTNTLQTAKTPTSHSRKHTFVRVVGPVGITMTWSWRSLRCPGDVSASTSSKCTRDMRCMRRLSDDDGYIGGAPLRQVCSVWQFL